MAPSCPTWSAARTILTVSCSFFARRRFRFVFCTRGVRLLNTNTTRPAAPQQALRLWEFFVVNVDEAMATYRAQVGNVELEKGTQADLVHKAYTPGRHGHKLNIAAAACTLGRTDPAAPVTDEEYARDCSARSSITHHAACRTLGYSRCVGSLTSGTTSSI